MCIEHLENAITMQSAKNKLLNSWNWICCNDGSGYLQSPNGNSYFHYDWSTTEYKHTTKDSYSLWGTRNDDGTSTTFKDFQEYAEQYVIKHYLKTNNLEVLKNEENVIFLDASVETIISHLQNERNKRPLLKESENLNKKIEELLSTRYEKYSNVSDILIDINGKNIDEVISQILVYI